MKRDLLYESESIRLYRTSWGSGQDALPGIWQRTDRYRISFPQTPLFYESPSKTHLVMPGDAIVWGIAGTHLVRNMRHTRQQSMDQHQPRVIESNNTLLTTNDALNNGQAVLSPDTRAALAIKSIANAIDSGIADPTETQTFLLDIIDHVCSRLPHTHQDLTTNNKHSDAVIHAIDLLSTGNPDLTLSRIGKEVHLSPQYFCRIFKRFTGMSIHEYRTRCRILRAVDHLIEGSSPLSAIADDCGFSDQPHMTRCFNTTFGLTPLRIATNHRELGRFHSLLQQSCGSGPQTPNIR